MPPETEFQSLPPAIQELEKKRAAFKVPDLQLPSYDTFGKSKDRVFNREGDNLTPRKPTFQERQQADIAKMSKSYNSLNPIAEYSREESKGYTNPSLPYDPTVDMNELYARYDPVTWGDSFSKMWDTYYINAMSGTQNLWQGLKEGVTEGRVSAIWDNKYSKELAEITEAMEKARPMRFAQEEQGTTSAWLKQLLPSLGYVGSAVTEMAVQQGVLTLGGAVVGAVAGEGVGAVPGAVVGAGLATVKNAQTAATALLNISRAARAINTLSTANKIKKGAQLFGYGLLSANGEAALNSQMAYRASLEKAKQQHFQQTGQYLTGEALTKAEEDAKKTGSVTMALNLPLIAATNIFEFGNLIRGKAGPSVIDKLAFKIDKATGKAVMKNPALKVGSRYLLESGSEGFEEFAQGVIEDATVDYYTRKVEDRNSLLGAFAKATFERAKSGQGASDFLGGALIGGLSNSADIFAYKAVKANSQRFVDDYNTATAAHFESFADALRTNAELKNGILSGDREAVRNAYRRGLTHMVNAHARAGSTEAFAETLDALSEMDNSEFKTTFGINVTPEEQQVIMDDMRADYARYSLVRKSVDGAFQVNPYESENWLQSKLNSFNPNYNIDKAGAAHVWEVFKNTLTTNLIHADSLDQNINRLGTLGNSMSPRFELLAGFDVPTIVSDYIKTLEARVAADLSDKAVTQRLLDKIKSHSDIGKQYQEILRYEDAAVPGIRDVVLAYNREAATLNLLQGKIGKLNTPKGQRRELKKIVDWHLFYQSRLSDDVDAQAQPLVPVATSPTTSQVSVQQPIPVVPVAPDVPDVPVAPAVTQPVSPSTLPSPVPDDVAEDDVELDLGDLENVDEVYGEGKTEDSPVILRSSDVEEPVRTVVPQILEPDQPDDLMVNETVLPQAIEDMTDGQQILPALSGVSVTTPDGDKVLTITKQGDEIILTTESGNTVPLPQQELAQMEVSADDTPLGMFIANNKLTEEQIVFLQKLQKGNYAELSC